ncbi:MAG: hypothetical protein OFPI_32230 [Osedax symbiont Rs2]|nr:MAG: hypothetical protein OFPI_32230 [Osedax symbiont Rs2]
MSDNLYFEPPSRLQLVDKLAHLLRFSNTFLVLAGPSGSGVSTVVEQLHHQVVEDDVYILSLDLQASTNLDALLGLLNGALNELVKPEASDLAKDKLSLLQQKIETLAELQRKLLVSIDNADHLTKEATQSLANLLAANQGEIAVIIAGSQQLVSKASKLVLSENLAGNLHTEILSPFNRVEAEEFIQLRFVRGGDFSARQLSDIYLNSEGYPGRITQLTSQMIQTGKIKLNGKSTLLPMPHIVGIAVLITAITAVSSWQYFADDSLLDDADQLANRNTQELTLDLVEEDSEDSSIADLATTQAHTASSLNLEIEKLSVRIKAQEALLEQTQADSQLAVSDKVSSEPLEQTISSVVPGVSGTVKAEAVSAEIASASASAPKEPETATQRASQSVLAAGLKTQSKATKAVVEDVDDSAKNIEKSVLNKTVVEVQKPTTAELKSTAPDVALKVKKVAAKLQVAAKESAQRELQKSSEKNLEQQLLDLTSQLKANIDPALLKRAALPKSEIKSGVLVTESSITKSYNADKAVVSQRPKPQSVVAKRIVAEEVLVADKQAAKKPKAASSTAKPVLAKKVSNVKSSARSSQDLIAKWPASGYTLQLLGARSEASVVNFLQQMPNSQHMYYYQTTLKNRPWNVIIYGKYQNRSAAKTAIAKLPAELRRLKPWIKSIASVQKSIKK